MTESPPTLVVISGLPGSGKTTHARRLEQEIGAIRFCPDEWMMAPEINLHDEERRGQIEHLQWALAKRALSLGLSVLIEWGTWSRSERDQLREEAQHLGARVELHFLTAPLEVLFDRVQRRGQEEPPLTRKDIERWADLIEPPSPAEMVLYERAFTVVTDAPP